MKLAVESSLRAAAGKMDFKFLYQFMSYRFSMWAEIFHRYVTIIYAMEGYLKVVLMNIETGPTRSQNSI